MNSTMNGIGKHDVVGREEFVNAIWERIAARWDSSNLHRVAECLEIWCNRRQAAPYAHQKARGCYLPGLPDRAWINPEQFAFSGLLEDNFLAILTEATQLMDGRLAAPAYGLADNAKANDPPYRRNPPGWREWRLFACGLWLEERCKSFPLTTNVIRQISASTPFLMNAIFMIMQPGAMLEPHHDNNNIFVSLWLPIIIPAKCAIKVAGITRVPEPGKCLAFNHSYEHSSWNFSDTARVVLNISHFHPDLTAEEQEVFAFLLPHMERYITEQESVARL